MTQPANNSKVIAYFTWFGFATGVVLTLWAAVFLVLLLVGTMTSDTTGEMLIDPHNLGVVFGMTLFLAVPLWLVGVTLSAIALYLAERGRRMAPLLALLLNLGPFVLMSALIAFGILVNLMASNASELSGLPGVVEPLRT